MFIIHLFRILIVSYFARNYVDLRRPTWLPCNEGDALCIFHKSRQSMLGDSVLLQGLQTPLDILPLLVGHETNQAIG